MTPNEFADLDENAKRAIRAGLSDLGKAACDYCDLGWSILPLGEQSKIPIAGSGIGEACDDWEDACFFWMNNPKCNVAIATGGPSEGLVVIDVDQNEDKGKYGAESLFDWEQANGKLPETVCADSGSGGKHYYYRTPTSIGCASNRVLCIDRKGDGGYVVAPPSVHPDGTLYQWDIDPFDNEPAFVDSRVLEFIAYCDAGDSGEDNKGVDGKFKFPDHVNDGEGREKHLLSYAMSLRTSGLGYEAILAKLQEVNAGRVHPPKPASHLRRIARSAARKKAGLSPEYQAAKEKAEKRRQKQAEEQAEKYEQELKAQVLDGGTLDYKPKSITPEIIDRNKDGKPLSTITNFTKVLQQDENLAGRFTYDMRAYTRMIRCPVPWEPTSYGERQLKDSDYSNFTKYCEAYGLLNGKQKAVDAIEIVCAARPRNTVAEWLDSLTWDGLPRMETVMQVFLGVPMYDYEIAVTRTFFAGALSRAYNPGGQFDYVPVLIGKQGLGKSVFCRKLVCGHRTWFGDNFNTFNGDDAVEKMRGIWIAEISELTALKNSRDNQTIKGFLTARDDTIRPKYGRETEKRKRACVFIGTTNDASFLTDPTGNRRFLPLECGKSEILKSLWNDDANVYFEQVWAEAVQQFKNGDLLPVLPAAFQREAIERQESYTEDNPNVGLIQGYLDDKLRDFKADELRRGATAIDFMGCRVCVTELIELALKATDYQKQSKFLINEVHEIMQNKISGWQKYPQNNGRARCDGYGVQRCYVPMEVASE